MDLEVGEGDSISPRKVVTTDSVNNCESQTHEVNV